MRYLLITFFTCFCCYLAAAQTPRVYTLEARVLQQNKQAWLNGDSVVKEKVTTLLALADSCLLLRPQSVMDKHLTPPSGTKHDYMSMGPYWWPDPSKPDGLPYIRKDGQRNPEIRKITDREYLGELENRCKYLSLAYYFTGDERYAQKAETLLKVWFINPATCMNPNLNFGQAIPGLTDGRGIGIIESRLFVDILNWVGLLETAPRLDTTLSALKTWIDHYLTWMLSSKNGKEEMQSKNNHGTYDALQLAVYASFTGNEAVLKQVFSSLGSRMQEQFQSDGRQPLELERTNALGYSTMNLSGWFSLAILGEHYGKDLWHQITPATAGPEQAFLWLYPYALGEKPFPYQQISPYHQADFYPLLLIADRKLKPGIRQTYGSGFKQDQALQIMDLLYLSPSN